MTKEEKIKEVYGEFWELLKDFLDENGWTQKRSLIPNFKIRNYDSKRVEGQRLTYKWRPKSLSGIENNNGWIKIESEADLPKESGEYWIINKYGTMMQANYLEDRKVFFRYGDVSITHYQPIQKPELPIY